MARRESADQIENNESKKTPNYTHDNQNQKKVFQKLQSRQRDYLNKLTNRSSSFGVGLENSKVLSRSIRRVNIQQLDSDQSVDSIDQTQRQLEKKRRILKSISAVNNSCSSVH